MMSRNNNTSYFDTREENSPNRYDNYEEIKKKLWQNRRFQQKHKITRQDNRYYTQNKIQDRQKAQLIKCQQILSIKCKYFKSELCKMSGFKLIINYFSTLFIYYIISISIFYPIFYKTNILIFLIFYYRFNCTTPMNQKFSLGQYEVCVNFKTDNVFVCSAEFLPTGQLFLSQTIELTRIKKDTVIATLQRKSQKHLRCQFQHLVGKNQKQLAIKFIVSYDFLPEFCEEVVLDFVEKSDKIKSLQVNNFKADITQMQTMIDAFQKNGVWNFNQTASVAFTSGKTVELKTLEVTRGKYLLRVSGIYTNSTGVAGNKDTLTFKMTAPGQKDFIKKLVTMNSVSGYSYPFSIEEVIDCKQGQLKVEVQATGAQGTYTNVYVITCPISEFK